MFSTKRGATSLALIVILGLVILKFLIAFLTGSISIFAQAADSFLDVIAVLIVFFSIRISIKPADEEHPFGHGKIESISAVAQAILIFTAGGLIIYSAINRIISEETVELTEAGIGVMAVSIIASILLSRHLLKVSKTTDSLAIEAIGHNIAADVYSAAGVLVGLVVIRVTGFVILDPIIALIVSIIILKSAYNVIRKSFHGLMDARLPGAEEKEIASCLKEHSEQLVGFHKLRTRKAGNQRFIDLHLIMPKDASVEEAHRVCDHLEQDLEDRLTNTNVTIHIEPCSVECGQCFVDCNLQRKTT
ncbi:MAG: cation diffusion facilitator family transporter [Dehalococcoidales bacterium]|nr:cation diffusion facilitator family transporter [Dehalococcoidales bacterium]